MEYNPSADANGIWELQRSPIPTAGLSLLRSESATGLVRYPDLKTTQSLLLYADLASCGLCSAVS